MYRKRNENDVAKMLQDDITTGHENGTNMARNRKLFTQKHFIVETLKTL